MKKFIKVMFPVLSLLMIINGVTFVSAQESRAIYPERETLTDSETALGGDIVLSLTATADVYQGSKVEAVSQSLSYNKPFNYGYTTTTSPYWASFSGGKYCSATGKFTYSTNAWSLTPKVWFYY